MDFLPENTVQLEQLLPLIRERLAAGEAVSFMPRGTSMLPMLRQGRDAVVLSPLPETLRKYDLPLYRRENGQFVLHRIVKVGDTYTCIGDNQFRQEPGVRREQMIGLVTAFRRDGKEYSVNSPRYRWYCRFWHFSRPLRRVLYWLRRRMK